MADASKPEIVQLVQCKCRDGDLPKLDVIRKLDDEDVDAAKKRRESKSGLPTPTQHFKHTGVVPEKLLSILNDEELKLVDARYQRRMVINDYDHSVKYHVLVTFEFRAVSTNKPVRDKELASSGMKALRQYLDKRWERVLVTTYPNSPWLQTVLFVAEAENPKDPKPIEDKEAEKFGMTITRRNRAIQTA